MLLQDAVSVALERKIPSHLISTLVGSPSERRKERDRRSLAMSLLEPLGLSVHAAQQVRALSTGTRRLAELACASALGARIILLDEPTAGLTVQEAGSFVRVVHDLRERAGVTFVIIDHDVPMIRSVVDRLYVLEAGRLIASGPTSILDTNKRVVSAYMGAGRSAATGGQDPGY